MTDDVFEIRGVSVGVAVTCIFLRKHNFDGILTKTELNWVFWTCYTLIYSYLNVIEIQFIQYVTCKIHPSTSLFPTTA